MANAMKKLKTLHNINTTPSHSDHHRHSPPAVNSAPAHYIHHKLPTTPPSSNSSPTDKPKRHHRSRIPIPVYYQQPLTPPISPTGSSVSNSAPPSPQQNQHQRATAPAQTQKYYADMLRSARQALHQLQHHHHAPPAPQVAQQQQQQRSVHPVLSEIAAQSQQQKRHPALPGGAFLPLTQDNSPPVICIPSSSAASQQHQRANIPALPLIGSQQFPTSATSNSRTAAPQTPARSSRRKPLPLTKNAVELILQDTRMARWQRVQGYVREQRQLMASEQNEERRNGLRRGSNAAENPIEGEGYPWEKYMHRWTREANKNTVNLENIYAEIDRKNFLLCQLDTLPEIQKRSIWSGGSAGTNGVDEFVWDDDEEGFQGDADMLDVDNWDNHEREKMKRAYQRQQLKMQQEAQMLKMRQQQQAEAVEERFMKEEEARAAVADHRRRYHRSAAADTPPRTPTSSGSSSKQQQTAQATPPQLKAYTASFFKSKGHLTPHQQQRSPRQEHSRPGTAGSGSVSPGYKRQSIGRGIVGGTGKTGSFGSVDGAVFRMDGEPMDVDNFNNLPLPSSYLTRATQYQQHSRGSSTPSYCSPTFASLGKSRTGAVAGGACRSPTGQPMTTAMDKGLREYMEALRRYEVRCAADAEQVNDSGSSGKRRRRHANAVGSYY
ncbi:hypothetical protein EV426DRAFT_705701 [Tirmania nivea]|nr:hypothetical protein EV426DRAFT_705701 [Tirmania nivea]